MRQLLLKKNKKKERGSVYIYHKNYHRWQIKNISTSGTIANLVRWPQQKNPATPTHTHFEKFGRGEIQNDEDK